MRPFSPRIYWPCSHPEGLSWWWRKAKIAVNCCHSKSPVSLTLFHWKHPLRLYLYESALWSHVFTPSVLRQLSGWAAWRCGLGLSVLTWDTRREGRLTPACHAQYWDRRHQTDKNKKITNKLKLFFDKIWFDSTTLNESVSIIHWLVITPHHQPNEAPHNLSRVTWGTILVLSDDFTCEAAQACV